MSSFCFEWSWKCAVICLDALLLRVSFGWSLSIEASLYCLFLFSFINSYEICPFCDASVIFYRFCLRLGIAYLRNGCLISRSVISIFCTIISRLMICSLSCSLFLYLAFIDRMADSLASIFQGLSFYSFLQIRY